MKVTLLLKEDGATPLKIEAAQDYINELEAQVKLLGRSKGNIQHELDLYKGEYAIHNHFKDMLIQMLQQHEVVDVLKDELVDALDISSTVEDVIYDYDFSDIVQDNIDEYEIVDNVVDSMTFESRVEELVNERLKEINFKVIVEE